MPKKIRNVILCGVITLTATLARGTSDQRAGFADLRQIQPIQGDTASGSQKAQVCAACHGADGAPTAPIFPRLSGQRPNYLYHRLVAFHTADPKSPYYSASPMTPLAAALNDRDMRDLAAYFASQAPKAAPAGKAEPDTAHGAADATSRGQQIFMTGDPSLGIPPCQGCHGPDANGSSVKSGQYIAYPSLRGQSGPFLISRLKNFRDGLPNNTSTSLIMGGVARNLDDDSIASLAAWLSSLSPEPSF